MVCLDWPFKCYILKGSVTAEGIIAYGSFNCKSYHSSSCHYLIFQNLEFLSASAVHLIPIRLLLCPIDKPSSYWFILPVNVAKAENKPCIMPLREWPEELWGQHVGGVQQRGGCVRAECSCVRAVWWRRCSCVAAVWGQPPCCVEVALLQCRDGVEVAWGCVGGRRESWLLLCGAWVGATWRLWGGSIRSRASGAMVAPEVTVEGCTCQCWCTCFLYFSMLLLSFLLMSLSLYSFKCLFWYLSRHALIWVPVKQHFQPAN